MFRKLLYAAAATALLAPVAHAASYDVNGSALAFASQGAFASLNSLGSATAQKGGSTAYIATQGGGAPYVLSYSQPGTGPFDGASGGVNVDYDFRFTLDHASFVSLANILANVAPGDTPPIQVLIRGEVFLFSGAHGQSNAVIAGSGVQPINQKNFGCNFGAGDCGWQSYSVLSTFGIAGIDTFGGRIHMAVDTGVFEGGGAEQALAYLDPTLSLEGVDYQTIAWELPDGFTNASGGRNPPAGFAFGVPGFDAVGGGVPEPASWGLMIAGFGLSGAALRRRRALTTRVSGGMTRRPAVLCAAWPPLACVS